MLTARLLSAMAGAMKNSFRISCPPPDEKNADAQSCETALRRRQERVSAGFANAGGGGRRQERVSAGFANAGGGVGASGRSNRTGVIFLKRLRSFPSHPKQAQQNCVRQSVAEAVDNVNRHRSASINQRISAFRICPGRAFFQEAAVHGRDAPADKAL